MKNLSSAEIRSAFLTYFEKRGHQIVPSSSLVPGNDPTLLFTNAGMVQFKNVFLGEEKRSYTMATSSQRCVRAGGKHNDLENVGYTARHHTFFEMLGNFSFGEYFKRDAIKYAWDFLVEELGIPAEKLWVTVFDEDTEAADIWLNEVGVDADRLSRIGAKDNFWSMGETGPCGPCSEIFYDHGEQVAGGPPGTPEEDGDRYVEIWNLVFMQYDRNDKGELTPLPKPSVDTGMGLERVAAVLQGVHNNYDIELFKSLIKNAAILTGTKDTSHTSLRVLVDHIRSCAFLIVDGVQPSNEGRGYVLRRIIRRAIRHGYKLDMKEVFFHKLVQPLVEQMGSAYPELTEKADMVSNILLKEEQRFAETLEQGMKLLQDGTQSLKDKLITGETAFKLYDTYGFPVDLTADYARENGLTVDFDGFEKAMDAQRERARSASSFSADGPDLPHLTQATEFIGYESLQAESKLEAIYKNGEQSSTICEGESGYLVLDKTPFYAESGGQAGDHGQITTPTAIFDVVDVQKKADAYFHIGQVSKGEFKSEQVVRAVVDKNNRQATASNHSATHLLHAALRKVLGEHVTQKGSLVEASRLRFDFSHFEPITAAQLQEIERLVNAQIRFNEEVQTQVTDQETAIANGAMALFGEKYGDKVRVLKMGEFSTELCGGTHVNRVGDIGLIKILSETGIASGVRRIEAIAGEGALSWVEQSDELLQKIAKVVKGNRESALEKVVQIQDKNKALEKELEQLKGQLATAASGDLQNQAVQIDGLNVLAANIEGADNKTLRDLVDQLKDKLGNAAVVLSTTQGEKITLIAGVSKNQTDRIKAGELVNSVALQVGGKGGGRADMAQAGGNDLAALEGALKSVPTWVEKKLTDAS
ncbi:MULTISPECIES: alanine--tRNA ligase [Cycloclasticus]|uniref:alanine--tRNA ligase n=1 Tax=Cycloclasticus TaxID=34067 RepID=UPI000932A32C|nr:MULTISPECIES: alanine--tRNA ligase [Cycloclasticus]MBV1899931.1 alanine--tRNA ligase [Cycloclasticus sp.]MDF1829892.1 alanine--tRNA ligase [Cycloclasticus pugetii]